MYVVEIRYKINEIWERERERERENLVYLSTILEY